MTGVRPSHGLEVGRPGEGAIEARYRTLFDYAPDGILIADSNGIYVDANPSMCRMLGYTRAQLIGLNGLDIVAPAEVEHIAPALDTIFAHEAHTRLWLCRRKDGSTFPAEVVARMMPDGNLVGIFRDVTENKRAERALREREAQLELASRVAKLGAWTVELPCGPLRWSRELLAMRGLPPDTEPNPELALSFYAPEYRALISAKTEVCAREGTAFDVEVEAVTAARPRLWVRVIGQAERNEAGQIVRIHGTVQDIDDQHTLQDQMYQAQKMEAVGRLAGGVAHDFNNMLSVILGYVDLAQQRLPPDAPGGQELLEIQRAAQRSAELTRDLLAFSRKQLVHPRAVDVAQLLANMENMLQRLLGEDVELTLQAASESRTVFADPKQLEQIVMNLSVNARDAMLRGGKLHIEVGSIDLDSPLTSHQVEIGPGSYVTLSVTDNGCGMDAATRARIFEPFFTTKEQGKGTGLGLSTVFGIVQQSRGHITVHSEPGCGSTFQVYWPRIDARPETLVPPPPQPKSVGGNETILLVEDEDQVRQVSYEILTGAGYRLLVACDAAQALTLAQNHAEPIDLLLTDVVMARVSGRELADKLAPLRPEMRVLYVSGYTHGAIVHQGVLEPGIAFLQKPLTRRMLLEKVRGVLDGRRVGSVSKYAPPRAGKA